MANGNQGFILPMPISPKEKGFTLGVGMHLDVIDSAAVAKVLVGTLLKETQDGVLLWVHEAEAISRSTENGFACVFHTLPSIIIRMTEFRQGESDSPRIFRRWPLKALEHIPRTIVVVQLPAAPFNVFDAVLDLYDDWFMCHVFLHVKVEIVGCQGHFELRANIAHVVTIHANGTLHAIHAQVTCSRLVADDVEFMGQESSVCQ